jgi:hypothetical protein
LTSLLQEADIREIQGAQDDALPEPPIAHERIHKRLAQLWRKYADYMNTEPYAPEWDEDDADLADMIDRFAWWLLSLYSCAIARKPPILSERKDSRAE